MERLWAKVDASGSCWLWTAYVDPTGYGRFGVGGTMRRAHRVVWETLVGPVPDGLELDHLCRVRRCVNPDHLEPVTRRENVRRGVAALLQRQKTHCPSGHSYAEHAYEVPSRPGVRYCQECNRVRSRLNRQANNAASRRYRARKRGGDVG